MKKLFWILCVAGTFFSLPAVGADFQPIYGRVKVPHVPYHSDISIRGGSTIPEELTVSLPVVEDPDWYYPRLESTSQKSEYGGRFGLGSGYLAILDEALRGNPVAMADLILHADYAPDRLAAAFPQFPPAMHTKQFWLDWAARYTSMGWIYARLSVYDQGIGHTRTAYTKGAELGDPESMYFYVTKYGIGEEIQWMLVSANAGWGPAARKLSGWYRHGKNDYGFSLPQDVEKKKHYLNIAMEKGHSYAFMDAAYDSFTGFQGTPVDLEAAYTDCYLFYELAIAKDGLLLVDRQIPNIKDLTVQDFQSCAYQVSRPPQAPSFEEKAAKEQLKHKAEATLPLSEEENARAKQKAYEWLTSYKAKREAELQSERARRALLTQKLRKELASVVVYIEKAKAAQSE